jgi:H+-transporting ATPase
MDKTGTITMNRLGVTGVIPQNGFTSDDVVMYGALASEEANQDPIDLAFLAAARHPGVVDQDSSTKTIHVTPFDARARRTEALVEQSGLRRQARSPAGSAPHS